MISVHHSQKAVKQEVKRMQTALREKRLDAKLSQTKLAYKARVPPCVISDAERGLRLPWPAARRALADALGVSESELFPDGHTESP